MKYGMIRAEYEARHKDLKLQYGEFYYDKLNFYAAESELKKEFKDKYFDLQDFEYEATKIIKELIKDKGYSETEELINKLLNEIEI